MLKQTQTNPTNLISCENELSKLFFDGCKSQKIVKEKNIGLEYEKLPVLKQNGQAASYFEISKVLTELQKQTKTVKNKIIENNALIGLNTSYGDITLEPGSQTEISLKPKNSLSHIEKDINNYNKITKEIGEKYFIDWLGCGIQPISTYHNIQIIPKKRYEFMTKYLPTVGTQPLVMMRETAGIQTSIDYSSEEDAIKKFSFALKLSPIVSAIFSNSPIRNSQLTKYKSNRALSWLNTDNARCGLVSPKLFNNTLDFNFESYVQILLDIPMIFIEREINGIKTAIKIENLTFRQFIQQGFQGYKACKQDWQTHLSLYFPDVRFKTYIEIRNHDSQNQSLILSIPALWKGLIYNDDARETVLNIVKNFTYEDFQTIRHNTPRYGIDFKIKNKSLNDIAKEIVNIAYQSLKSQKLNEEIYLEPILELTQNNLTPADKIIKLWENDWKCNLQKYIEYIKL